MCNVKRKSDCRLTMSPTAPLSVFPCTPTCLYVIKLGGVSKPLFPPRKIFELPLFGESEDFWVELKSMTVIKHSPALPCPALPCPARHNLPYPILSYPILSHPILSHPIISNPIQSYPVLSYPILSYPILSYRSPQCSLSLILFLCDAFTCPPPYHYSHLFSAPILPSTPKLSYSHSRLVFIYILPASRHVQRHRSVLLCSALLSIVLSCR